MAQTDEIIVRFKAEGGETVEEAFRRVGAAGDKAGGGTDRVNKSLDGLRLKSEERVARNLGAIATELAHGGSAADVAAVAISRLGESFRGAFSVAAAGAVGFGLYEAITRTGEAVIKLNSEVISLTRPRGSSDFLGMDALNKNLDDVAAKIRQISSQQINRSNSLLSSLLGTGGFAPTAGIVPALNKADQEKINELQKAAAEIVTDITHKTQNLNKIEYDRTHVSELQADLDKAEIEHKERLGALAAAAAAAGIAGTKAARDSLSAENERANVEARNLREKSDLENEAVDHAELLADIDKNSVSDLDRNLKKLQEEVFYRQKLVELARTQEERNRALAGLSQAEANQVNAIRKAALDGMVSVNQIGQLQQEFYNRLVRPFDVGPLKRAQAAEAEDLSKAQAKQGDLVEAERLHRLAKELLAEADAIKGGRTLLEEEARDRLGLGKAAGKAAGSSTAGGDFSGISSLSGLEFKGLKNLDGLDFKGLLALDGLSIKIA